MRRKYSVNSDSIPKYSYTLIQKQQDAGSRFGALLLLKIKPFVKHLIIIVVLMGRKDHNDEQTGQIVV